ncbi:MAG: MFS transporter [Rhodocyclaceae bacterium]
MAKAHDIDVQTFLDEQPFSPFQWLILGLCFLIVLLDGFDTAAIGYIAPSLVKEWGVTKPALAPVLSAALFGLAAGALAAGPLADRFGRKRVLLVSVAVFGAGCLASSFAADLDQLTLLRFVTGLGLGAAMPNAVTLVSEYCPERRRALITNAMFCGFPLGAALGGFLAAWMIPNWGWRSVLALGGAIPLILMVPLLLSLPESVRYLVAKNAGVERIRAVLGRISASVADATAFVMAEQVGRKASILGGPAAAPAPGGLRLVLSRSYVVASLMLWVAYFMGLVMFYALINWMPILFKDAGVEAQRATLIAAMFPLGGVGAIVFGWLMDRFNANRVIAAGYAFTAVAVYFIGQTAGNDGLLVLAVFVAGTLLNTAQASMPALAAVFYPTPGRATGVAWMLGVGRFGGIAGSFLIAELSRRHLGFDEIFMVVAVAGLVASAAVLVKQYTHPEKRRTGALVEIDAVGH